MTSDLPAKAKSRDLAYSLRICTYCLGDLVVVSPVAGGSSLCCCQCGRLFPEDRGVPPAVTGLLAAPSAPRRQQPRVA
jgi:hypothetical protein